ncbi:hypothetical protein BJ322DRAFT_765437 [Thelephora terrestris]|uniref:Uncharacterized protein n=1 Tax=Thelephora terrestris TaxID=56493 RepID=A0A9P6HH23_9AGAM|nr:hypothetical protein BJ322DRAFT_765437 [Thelephora terrestris]
MHPTAGLLLTFCLSLFASVNAGPYARRKAHSLQNGQDAIALNAKFESLTPTSPCTTDSEVACINDQLARCVRGHFDLIPCDVGLVCRASPKIDSPGMTIGCVKENRNTKRTPATRALHAIRQEDPSQTSLCLDPAVLSTGFENDGQGDTTNPPQVQSQTSSNNWINFCKTVNKPLTNGTQIPGGSCNPAPIGVIPSVDNIPSAKIIFPPNFETLAKNSTFTIKVAVNNLETGWATNSNTTFLSAPVVVNANGDVMGHSHVVAELLTGFGQTTPTNPKLFAFFKRLELPAVNGVLSTNVTGGLPAGHYRLAVIHSGANHQPIAAPVAQRGAMGDMVYFTVI